MTPIEDFIYDRMTAYLNGGMGAETAADFTRGELKAIYADNHWTHGERTKPPEAITMNEAMKQGEDALNTIMDIMKTTPQSAIEAHGEAQNAFNVVNDIEPQMDALQTQHKAIETLQQYLECGIKLIPCRAFQDEKGETKYRPIYSGERIKENAISNIEILKKYMQGGELWTGYGADNEHLYEPITMFRFIPKDNGLLVIDIDRGHGDGIDGLEVFYKFFEGVEVYRETMPNKLKDIENFPCYVSTPSGGYQLVFKYHGDKKLKSTLDGKGVDILYTKFATAAGSKKVNGTYILHGNLKDAPDLFLFIEKRIMQLEPPPIQHTPTQFTAQKPFAGQTTWEKVIDFTDKDGYGTGGRNERAYSIALHAKTHGWDYQTTLDRLLTEPSISGLPKSEIVTALNSAYKERRSA